MKKADLAAMLVVGCLAFCGSAVQASASSITGNFSGTTGNLTGVFQNVDGSEVSNTAFTGSFTVDLDVPHTSTQINVPPPDELYRYLFLTGVTFTINIGTHVFSFDTYDNGFLQQRKNVASDSFVAFSVVQTIGTMFNLAGIDVRGPAASLFDNVADPSTIHVSGQPGSLVMESAEGRGATGDTIYARWQIPLDSISLEQVASVPGPIVGAGLPGLAMALSGGLIAWRRRRLAAA